MKTIAISIAIIFWAIALNAQHGILPEVSLKTLDGTDVSAISIIEPGTITILVFWKSSNNTCKENLDNLQDIWLENLKKSNLKLISICVDSKGSWNHIKPIVNGNNWDFDTYIDVNGDLKRAMNVNTFPCTIALDTLQDQLCRYENYCPGIEELMYQTIMNEALADLEKHD